MRKSIRLSSRAHVGKAAKPSALTGGAVVPLLTAEARLKRALRYHLHHLGFKRTPEGGLAPPDSSKECYRHLHSAQLLERLTVERSFIAHQWPRLRSFFAEGSEVDPSQIAPRLEMVEVETWQSNLFRLAALTWRRR